MTALEILTLASLNSVTIRDQTNAEDFEEPLRSIIQRMKSGSAESIIELQRVLADECGMAWDGTGRLVDAILVEQKRLSAIARAKRQIREKIAALDQARKRLEYPCIAGKPAVEKAIEIVENIGVYDVIGLNLSHSENNGDPKL